MTRDSELALNLRADASLLVDMFSGKPPPQTGAIIDRLREAASRLEAIGEPPASPLPIAWRWRWKDQLEADGWCLSEDDPRPGSTPTRMERFGEVQPLYALPNQGETKP